MCLEVLVINTIAFFCVAETHQHTCQIPQSDHLWNCNIYIIMTDALQSELRWRFSLAFQIMQRPTSQHLQSETQCKCLMINAHRLPRSTSINANDDESHFWFWLLYAYSNICLQGNYATHATLSHAPDSSVAVHSSLSLMAFTAAQLHLGCLTLTHLGAGLRQHKYCEERSLD